MSPVKCWYRENVYGPAPNISLPPVAVRADGQLREVEVTWAGDVIPLAYAIPGPGVPVFIGLNFRGNHSIDAAVPLPFREEALGPDADAAHAEPGNHAHAWPWRDIVDRGFGFITAPYQLVLPDSPHRAQSTLSRRGQSPELRNIAYWAAFLSAMRRAIAATSGATYAIGHSRLGKAAFWAVAADPGFAGAVAIQSGQGGLGPIHAEEGETVAQITRAFPHWFVPAFAQFPPAPYDVADLLSEMTNMVVLALNAQDDRWANPDGQALQIQRARERNPRAKFASHIRPGGHRVMPEDWHRAIDLLTP